MYDYLHHSQLFGRNKIMAYAVRYSQYGDPDVLSLDQIPTPEPGPGQVRIAVRVAGVNPIDWKLRRGFFASGQQPEGPTGTGLDAAGVIDAVGSEVRDWKVGDAVFGQVSTGAAATHALAEPDKLLAKPAWLSFEQAAALPVVVETAYRALGLLDLKAGQTLLIHAAAGGVGLTASQLALRQGVKVIGTASERNHEFLRELGVQPVTYGDGLAERVRAIASDGVDAVLDASGRDVLGVSVELTGDPNKVLTIADGRAPEYGVRCSYGSSGTPLPQVLAEALPLLQRGELRIPITHTFPLEQTADAHRLSEEGHVRGKIVITVPESLRSE